MWSLEEKKISRKISELVKKEHKYRTFGNNGNYIVNTYIIGVFQTVIDLRGW